MSSASQKNYVIVVGFDESDTGEQALLEAMRLAKQLPQSELHVTSVIASGGKLHDKGELEHAANELRSRAGELHKHVLRVCAPGQSGDAFRQQVVLHVRLGDPATALIQVAADVEADLLVVGTHRRHGVDKMLAGSVAEALIRRAPLPVLVAYPRDFSGVPKTPRLDPAHAGEHLHDQGLSVRSHIEFVARTPHISGLL
jgi:nucleotide-binding universal stress UspA family protein